MLKLLTHIIDFIFPPSETEIRLRNLQPEDFYRNMAPALQTEFPFIYSIFSYKDKLVRELIWQIKYKKNKHSIECAGFALLKVIREKYKNNLNQILLIPIPISKKRRKERGYNQCELIVDSIVALDNRLTINYNLLIRNKNTEKQTFKNRNERIENTKKIFEVNPKAIPLNFNTQIILIDDVSTTGSTLREAREALVNAGFMTVTALTVAH